MEYLTIVFVCHDNNSVKKVLSYNYPIIFVGNKPIADEYRNNKNIVIARDLKNNIENEPKLLTFTAWYAIIKNNLFSNYNYICILEYDTWLSDNCILQLYNLCKFNYSNVISFTEDKEGYHFLRDVNKMVLQNFLNTKNLKINLNEKIPWGTSTNQCINRTILSDFIDWYYPDCLEIKIYDEVRLSWYHERLFMLYLKSKNIGYTVQSGLTHERGDSHSLNLNNTHGILNTTYKKYLLVYNDGSHTEHIDKLISSVKKYSDFVIVVYNKSDIDVEFINDNKNIFNEKRGGGYWLWKPYIINKLLSEIDNGDIIFYLDSTYFFVDHFGGLYEKIISDNDILIWSNKPNESINYMKNFCKMDVIHKYDMYETVFNNNALDCWAGAMILRKTPFIDKIMIEWLNMCCNYEDITDSESILPNSKEFKEHRHDQSLLSIVVHKNNIDLHFFETKYLQNVRQPWLLKNELLANSYFHGDPNRNNYFFIYPENKKLINQAWDFHSNPCLNYKEICVAENGPSIYECLGHQSGIDKYFHGDIKRENYFYVYPTNMNIVNNKWDFYSNPCENYQEIYTDVTGIKVYKCLGHDSSYLKNYHGDKNRGNYFFIYAKHLRIMHSDWDSYSIPCSNYREVSVDENAISAYECLGHI